MISVLKVECSSGNDVGSVVFMVTVQYHFINIDSSDI
nr:MAG TPA: Oligosaccaryltransferase [Caudoviricetes sp.]